MIPRHLLISVALMLAAALGMGLYLWHMRGKARASVPPTAGAQPIAPPVAGPTETVMLFVANDDEGSLRPTPARIPLPAGRQERAAEMLRALMDTYLDKASTHPLATGSEIREVYLVDPGVAVIDVNNAFSDNHRSGVLVEELTVASLIETLSANIPGITRVKILVDGKERETLAGHVDLTNFFELPAIHQLVVQLNSGQ